MRAAVCRTFHTPLSIEDLAIAEPGPNDLVIKISACAICHSDIHFIDGAWGGDLPAVAGHEAAGVVERVGGGVDGLAPGDEVVVTLIRSCGTCPSCASGGFPYCEAPGSRGSRPALQTRSSDIVQQWAGTGAFAEKVVVDRSQVVRIARDVPPASASLLACGVITGFGAVVNAARVPAGATVAVIGCGGVGLNSIQGAALSEAAIVVAIDLADAKLDAAIQFGATHAVNPARMNAGQQVRLLCGGRGADFVFVTVGSKAAIDASFAMLRRGGTTVIVGMPASGVLTEFDASSLAADGLRVIGTRMGDSDIQRDIPNLVDHYRAGRLKLDELVSGRYPLDAINEAIASVKRGEALRHVIEF